MTTTDQPATSPSAITITPPIGWEVFENLTEQVRLSMLAPTVDLATGFRPNLVLGTAPAALPLDDWIGVNDDHASEYLNDYRLLDIEQTEIAGRAAYHHLAHHHLDGIGLSLEQWSFIDEGDGWTLAGTAPDTRYCDLAPLFAQVAASLGAPSDVALGAPRPTGGPR